MSAVLVMAACAGPTGPVFGDWRGMDTTGMSFDLPEIELVLDGPAEATAGDYHLARQTHELFRSSPPFPAWDGAWTSRLVMVAGRRLRLVHLERMAYGHVADYVLLEDGRLAPVADPSRPDLSGAARYALAPVKRGSFGYGRP